MKFMNQLRRYAAPVVAGTSVMALSAPAFADASEAAAAIKASLTDVNTIGWAVIVVLAGVIVFKLIKRVM